MGSEAKQRRGEKLKKNCGNRLIEMPEGLGERLVKHCSEGFTIQSFCYLEKISWETLQEFRKTNKNFAERYKEAKLAQYYNCEKQLAEIIDETKDPRVFNALRFKIQNLIGWTDKTESKTKSKIEQTTTHKIDTSKLSDEELEKELAKLSE